MELLEDRRLLTATPQGDDFRVNQVVRGTQELSGGSDAVGIDALGNFVVAYAGSGSNKTNDIVAQRFAAGGSPLGDQIRVNQYVSGSQDLAAVGVRPGGQFVVVWSGKGASDSAGIFFRQFAADGTPLGSDQRVNVTTKDSQSRPAIAIGADGRFVVVWSGRGTGDASGVFLRRFNADGTPSGGEVRVNQTTSATQNQPDIALASDGSLAVSWSGKGVGDSQGVFLQRFAADGTRSGVETRINQTTAGLQERPDLVFDEVGGVIVVWNGRGLGDQAGIFSRRQANDGSLGSENRVNMGTQGLQQNAAIAAVGDGSYFVAWAGEHVDHGRAKVWDILSQQLDVSGQRLLTELVVNTSTKGIQSSPSVGSNRAGSTVAAWSGQGPGDSAGVFARRFSAPVDQHGPVLQASLVNDTGASGSDGVTSDPTIAGIVQDQSRVTKLEATFGTATGQFTDVSDLLQLDGRFSFSPAQLNALAGSPLTIGLHVLQLRATDQHGNATSTSVSFTLQPDGLFVADLGLSAASDSAPADDHRTNAGRVVLVGRTQPLANLTLAEGGATALANRDGLFQFPGLSLHSGLNTFTVTAANAGGESAQQQVTIERTEETAAPDPVLRWNQAALEAARQDASTPTYASRALAMVQVAIYDAVAAIDHSPNFLAALSAPNGASLEAAVTGAAQRVLDYLYPAQQAAFATTRAAALALVPDGIAENDGVAFGQAVADAVIAVRSGDGWDDFVPISTGNAAGEWQFTPPMYDPFLTPQWATLEPFSMTSPDQFRPSGPPGLSSQEFADAYNETRSLGQANSAVRTAEQTQIARFWADGAGTFTPPGHWNQIAEQIAQSTGNSVGENARLFAMLNIALADAAIACWDAKAAYSFWRPVTAIHAGGTDINDLTAPDDNWSPLLITPPFPEYVSGHSTFSGAGSAVLAAIFGDQTPFTTGSQSLPNVTRSFDSFTAAAEEAGRSRIYGGIHFQFSNEDGLATGRAVAQHVLATFSVSSDQIPPRIVIEQPDADRVTKTNIVVEGRVLDNLSGVQSFEAQLDEGPFAAVSLNASGQFSLPTQFALDGSADGEHAFHLRATDAAGNVSPVIEFAFALDTTAPSIGIASPTAGAAVAAEEVLTGAASGTGSDLTQLIYSLDSGTPFPVPFTASGDFSVPLNLSRLAAGQHTLVVQARDAAGNVASSSRPFQMATAIPLTLVEHTPQEGAVDLGTTFKPKIVFSRPINPATLTAANFFAAGPSGQPLPTKIVLSDDHTFAWLFPQAPMPGGSHITVHVNGSTILAAGDGQRLDADGDSAPGGSLEFSFTTVSLTPLIGTTLSGKVVDPGPDLKPMTFDDLRAGPDGALFTGDDLFLLPIAHAKVWIVGLEDQFVFTDTQGNFHFDAVPAGDVKLGIDGRTATGAPVGIYFPEMVMDLVIEAGRANTVMGSMGTAEERAAFRDRAEVYLPRLESSILHAVSPTQKTMIGVDARSAPNLTPQQRGLLTIEVPPGSLLDEHGNPVANGQVGISTVPPELVREMLPPGILRHTFDITIQAPGITNFSTPAAMTFPNVMNSPPGTQLSFLSFDHTTGRLVIDGTATVSAHGLSVTTDPDQGITHPGWHGLTPQGGPGGPEKRDPKALVCQSSVNGTTPEGEGPANLFSFGRSVATVGQPFVNVEDFLFATNQSRGRFIFKNLQPQDPCDPDRGELLIDVTVNNNTTNQFLSGLTTSTFYLKPNKDHSIDFFPRAFELGAKDPNLNLRKLNTDRLYGAKVSVEIRHAKSGELLADQPRPFYVYRYVDAGDDVSDAQLNFLPTLADGVDGSKNTRTIKMIGDPEIVDSHLLIFDSTHFPGARNPLDRSIVTIPFDPKSVAEVLYTPLTILTPDPNSRAVNDLTLIGEGRQAYRVFIDSAGLDKLLGELAAGLSSQDIDLQMNPPGMQLPGTFRFTVPGKAPSRVFILDATKIDKTELEAAFAELLGAGNFSIDVETDTVSVPNRVHLTILLQNALAQAPQPVIQIEASGANFVSKSAGPRARFGRITPNERELFRLVEKRVPLIQKVVKGIENHFAAFKGIEFTSDPGQATLTIDWATAQLSVIGKITGENIRQQTADLMKAVADGGLYNGKSQAYRLTKILARPKVASAVVYVDNILEDGGPAPFVLNADQFVNALVAAASHEAGHFFGLQHTSFLTLVQIAQEVQTLTVATRGNPGDTFTLSFAGEPGNQLLNANSTSGDVLAALLELNTIAASTNHVSVDGPVGGPWTVHFVHPGTPQSALARFSGSDVPPIIAEANPATGTIQVVVSEVINGKSELRVRPKTGRQLGIFRGQNDLMVAGGWPEITGTSDFLPRFSQPALQIGTFNYEIASNKDVKEYFDLLRFSMDIPGNPLELSLDPESDELPREFLNLELGPRLAVLQNEAGVGPEAVEFGKVEVDQAGGQTSVQTLTLLNFGSEDVVIRSIHVAEGYDQFFVAPFPVTMLHPGESLDVTVTFDPLFAGPASGALSIDSDAEGFDGSLDLVGEGQRTTADLRDDMPNANLGGSAVGQSLDRPPRGAILTNFGVLPVTITAVRMAPGPGDNEFFVGAFPYPVTLHPGESHEVLTNFRPSAAGLRRGVLEILSDDPHSPLIRKTLVGTGLVEGNVDYGNDFVALESVFRGLFDNTPVLRTRSDAGGNWEFFLGPETLVHIATFDPVSGLIAHGYATTNPSGQRTVFNIGAFQASAEPDTDGDGLPDDVEFAVGTSVDSLDTDGDGISDFAEVNQGLNPLDDRPTITGVIAALGLTSQRASANDITLVADTQDISRVTAFLATGDGLAIADVTQFDRPLLLGELVLPGISLDVEVDPQRQIGAVASGQGGLHLLNVSDPTRPVLLQTIPINASRVALFDGLAYVAVGNEIQSFDVFSGEPVEALSLGDGDVLGLRREGVLLFATNAFATQGKIHVIDLAGLGMVARGSLSLPRRGADLFVAEGVAWIAINDGTLGLMTVDVSQPDNLRLLSDTDRGTRLANGIALNGSGLGIIAGRVIGGAVGGTAIVVTADDPTRTAPTFTQFGLPQIGLAVALSSGLAYIADGSAGLQVLNFLAFDQGTSPPVVTLGGLDTDLDPVKLGIQMLEGSTVTLPARITDDVQVRSVELLVDGVRVSSDGSYPYDLTTTLPTILQTGNEAVLQVRATDTGGNVRLSDTIVIELLADLTPPTIVVLDPPDGSTQAISRRRITIRFSEPLNPLAAAAGSFELLGPGDVVTPLSVQLRQGNSLLELYYPPLAEGDYQFVMDGPAVTDRVGNSLGAGDLISSFHVGNIVREPTIQWINPAGGFWDDPANWDDGRLPGTDDDVLIDMPGDPTITFRQGDVQIRTLVSKNPFSITRGRLVVTETIQVNDSFTLRGPIDNTIGGLSNIATLSGTVLRGSGGQGLTIGGYSRLEAATILTDLTITESGTQLRIKNGLALLGTATLGPSSNIAIGFEGSQQVTSGTFVLTSSPGAAFGPSLEAIGVATVTFGKEVVVRGGTGFIGQKTFFAQGNTLHLINYGKISADVSGGVIITRAESLTNHGIIEAKAGGVLAVDDKTWTNTVTGRISASDARFPNSTSQLELGSSTTTSWSNAGIIDLTNTFAWFMRDTSSINQVWSNTGTILVQNSNVQFNGRFTSADVENVRQSDNSSRRIDIRGRMDNTGRTFTFTAETGKYYLAGAGRIVSGTLNMSGPKARLETLEGYLDGVTINGDLELGELDGTGFYREVPTVVNGLTLNGTVTINSSSGSLVFANGFRFEGAPQTVSGATFRGSPFFQMAINSGPVTLDASVTIHNTDQQNNAALVGNFISHATVTVEPGTFLSMRGGTINTNFDTAFINRGVIRVNPGNALIPGGNLGLTIDAVNEGTIIADRATLRLGGQGWRNTGVIEASQTQIEFGDGIPLNRIQTSDLGTIRNPGGTIALTQGMVLDNTGSTLVIDPTLGDQFILGGNNGGAAILGGTIQVAPSAHFLSSGGILQDLTVQGDLELFREGNLTLAGEVTFQGTVNARSGFFGPRLHLGYSQITPNQPLVIHAGTFDFGGPRPKTIDSLSTPVGDNTFGPGVVLRGRNVTATFVKPLLNQGSIIADLVPEFPGDTGQNTITFTSSPITNVGLLEAKGGGRLTINDLVTNRGTMKAGAGSVVSIGGNVPLEAAGIVTVEIDGPTSSQFGQVTADGTASLAGALNVQFAGGFTPTAGDTFQVMNYAGVSGTFGTVNVTGLPAGLVAVPVYNATNLTIVVGAGLAAASNQYPTGDTKALNSASLPAFVQEAIARWFQTGLYPEFVERLANVQWHVANLPGNALGMAANEAVWLDADAAGYGWFVDDSPHSDNEFQWLDDAQPARQGDAAEGRIDLLTAVMHELGHLLGLDDLLAEDDVSLLMSGTLRPGVRKVPASSTQY